MRNEIISKLFRGWTQLTNIFQRVQCRGNNFEIISEHFQRPKKFISVSDVVTCEIKH